MARINSRIELIPSARRMVMSLRDLGYDFSAAVADLVDNSIEAGAKRVSITIRFDGTDSWVSIVDDGAGMSLTTLTSAMRYGSEREYVDDDLGKFGLGLKTASLSQCRRLTVGSCEMASKGKLAVLRWDLEHIQEKNRWEVIPLSGKDVPEQIVRPLTKKKGTVVLWEQLDRMLGYEYPYGEYAKRRLLQMCRELEMHLGMVFHRFLSGEVKNRKIVLTINDNEVIPWDPFARSEKHPTSFKPTTIMVNQDGMKGQIVIQPYVLPHQDKFSSSHAHGMMAGPKKWNRQQGFYIYRADRMIQSGGWSGLRTLDEHTKLVRVALSFSPRLDEAFKINVAKMRVQLPAYTREEIEKALARVLRAAQAEYRNGGSKSKISPTPLPVGTPPISGATTQPQSSLPTAKITEVGLTPTVGLTKPDDSHAKPQITDEITKGFCIKLLSVARQDERNILLKLFQRLGIEDVMK
jgi:hypothetical protein